MTQPTLFDFESSESQRLKALVPVDLQDQVVVTRSSKARPRLITTERLGKQRLAIAIDLIQWEKLRLQDRDLLFWHEVARIQRGLLIRPRRELAVFGTALGISLMEVAAQDLLFLSIALVVVGLSGNQLYQRNRGERALREATSADQGAIALALQFGYSFSEATTSLRSAIQELGRQATRRVVKNRCKVRLQVLEIFVANQQTPLLQSTPAKTEVSFRQKQPLKIESICYSQS